MLMSKVDQWQLLYTKLSNTLSRNSNLAAFLNIEGVFNNMKIESIHNSPSLSMPVPFPES